MLKKVLIPVFMLALAAAQPALASNCSQHGMNLAEKAASAGIFNTLIAAAEAAGLVDVLANSGFLLDFEQVISLLLNPLRKLMLNGKVSGWKLWVVAWLIQRF